jgi:hypothetical protein
MDLDFNLGAFKIDKSFCREIDCDFFLLHHHVPESFLLSCITINDHISLFHLPKRLKGIAQVMIGPLFREVMDEEAGLLSILRATRFTGGVRLDD